jgi:hypothetical protein
MKKIAGIIMIVLFFAGMFIALALTESLYFALGITFIVAFWFFWIWLAIKLATS